ncbi:TAP domain-containing protein [Thozetella sp. PMI_491]|nr:TAP domain-containing protein [Thozetella sp. PMI_491]
MIARALPAKGLLALLWAPTQVVSGPLQWQKCTDIAFNATVPLLCGNLSVPLDYTSPSSGNLTLQLLKIEATKAPANGSKSTTILFNFGGPGEPDRLNLAQLSVKLLNMTGGIYDLISFDTRGTGNTIPFNCWGDPVTRALATAGTPSSGRASDTALGAQWAAGELLANACYAAANETGSLAGTAFVARDIIQIVDALNEGGLLRYWGFSYGTVLGATTAAMFPDRMDRVILDGVVNLAEYYHGYDIEKYHDTDKVFAAFVSGCVATPGNCAMAAGNLTAAELTAKIYTMLDNLKYNPIVLGPSVLDYSGALGLILGSLYSPALWPLLGLTIEGIFTKNVTLVEPLITLLSEGSDPQLNEYLAGIECSDKFPRASAVGDIAPHANRLFAASEFGSGQSLVFAWCAQWKMEAKERYTGDFHVQTRNPIMLIGNTFDPVTPLVSARNVSEGFEGSVVLQHNGHGHASIQQPSSCTINYVQDYFGTGKLPAAGTICQPDLPIFYSAPS